MSVKLTICILTLRLMVAILWGTFAMGSSAQVPVVAPTVGDGLTTNTAYQFTELGNLVWLKEQAAADTTAGVYYKLMCDIDASPTATWVVDASRNTLGFLPIGQVRSSGSFVPFRGIFDGNGHIITELSIKRPPGTSTYVGLFGLIGTEGTVKNLGLENCTMYGDYNVGGLAGKNSGTIINCHATGSVTGYCYIGGLAGVNDGAIEECYADSTVTGLEYIGGLVGRCALEFTVLNSYAIGIVDGGGCLGGLIGQYASTTGRVAFCYTANTVRGTGNFVGGFTGTCPDFSVGDDPFSLSDCFWDTQSSGMATSSGGIGKTTAEMKQLTTYQPGGGTGAKDWDFLSVWDMSPGINGGYPYLRSFMPKNGLSNWCAYE